MTMLRCVIACALAVVMLAATPSPSYTEEPLTVSIPQGHLSGTLMLPQESASPVPVALIIAGSGPVNRNGNVPGLQNDAYKKLAEALAARGIATLRYDKRGIGESTVVQTESDLRFDDYVNDALLLTEKLEQDKRFSKVEIIGHSEGSLIGILAAQRDPHVAALVSLEGAGRKLGAILDEQIKNNPSTPPSIVSEVQQIDASLEAGRTVPNLDPQLAALFRPSVQPYLISEYRYDPAAEIAKLNIPVLIVHGTHDIQVSEADASRLAFADQRARVVTVDGMNHTLVDAPADRAGNIATYSDPSLPLDQTLVTAIASFLR
ncbi:MAG: alpha/beta fold hydrolase [Candidatus Eremiobacteraeota bacterium]|nr:alpha/beta fold hydrolase [Candidatus Eremiobacteraeota bacterium]